MELEVKWPRRHARPPPAVVAGAAAAMSLVLGDDDLLREILLRLGLPTSLLRATLVCKRWLRHASDPAFLRGFRARHPPGLLGAYLSTAPPRFLPMRSLPRELAAAARHAGSFFDGAGLRGSSAIVRDSHGGRLLVTAFETHYGHTDSTHLVCSPLSPARDTVVVPPPIPPLPGKVTSPEDSVYHCHEFLPDDGDGRSYFCVLMGYSDQQTTVHLYELQDMYWVLRSSAASQLSVSPPRSKAVVLVDDTRFYMLSTANKILVCDFPSSSISAMELPDGVEEGHNGRVMMGIATWPSVEGQSAGVKIHAVGDNARFVFLEMLGAVVFLDMTSKKAEKVYELTPEDNNDLVSVHPLTLMWSPVFPRSTEGMT